MKKALCFLLLVFLQNYASVQLGVDRLFTDYKELIANRAIGLVTNHTGINSQNKSTISLCRNTGRLKALFAPEHGISGAEYADERVQDRFFHVPIYSLHGDKKRPTEEQLRDVDVLVYDIQDIGVRPYTYATTLFYVMEEAAKHHKSVVVLDRPNPLGGLIVDGPMLQENCRSFIGYVNVPYCHGMTIGELALFFNQEYGIGCDLTVVPMKGWTRDMTFQDTHLSWVPTSPHVPEPDTSLYMATTGSLGELDMINIGIGYTLPFKLIGAPWIDADRFSNELNRKMILGVHFLPFHYKPFYGSLKNTECHGVKIIATDMSSYRPFTVYYQILQVLKTLYPDKVKTKMTALSKQKSSLFCHAMGNESTLQFLLQDKAEFEQLLNKDHKEHTVFLKKRARYLLYN